MTGAGVAQAVVELRGAIEGAPFVTALRTAFPDAELTHEDWRDLPEPAAELERYLEADRERGLDAGAPPRAALFQRDDGWHDLVLTVPDPEDGGTAPAGRERCAAVCDLTALRELAAREGLELATFVEAAWALALATYTGRDEVGLGVAGSRRRVRVAWASRALALLRAWTADGWRSAERPGDGPQLDGAVAYDEAAGDGWRLRDLRRQPDVALALQAVAGPELLLALTYDPGRLQRDTAERLLELLRTLLEGIAARPEARLGDLPLLSERERRRVVGEGSATGSGHSRDACVHELVAARAAETPDALAVSGGGERLSYRQLDERAAALARRLRRLGAGPGTRVGMCVERSPDLVVGQLAVLRAGAAFVPLDPDAPGPRLEYVLRDAGIRVLLAQRPLLDRLPPAAVPTICLDDPEEPTPAGPEPRAAAATPGDLAYVIYTSGSTGRPKGVEVEHRALTSRATWCGCTGGMRASDRATQVANPSFDISVWEIWSCLVAGASLHLPDEGDRIAPARLAAWLRDERITVTFLPTPLGELVLEEPWPAGEALRAMFVGGDRLHRVRQERLPFELYNLYGPTEVTIISTSGAVRTGADGDALPPIGRPIADTRVSVLDPCLRPLPVGFAGELCIGGGGLARGYSGRPGLTAAAFVPDPHGGPGARLYRSGDLVRYTPDGSLEFLGRLDRQVKVRGVRIELGEIEAALLEQPGVAAAVATTAGNGSDLAIVAYAVPEPLAVQDADRLRAALARVLPEAMVPAAVVLLDELPLTPNGKVDRAALPPPPDGRPAYVAPRTPLEAMVAGIWGETLGVERVGLDDDFFQRGGHSLLAMQVILKIAEATRVEVPLRDLFDAPTVAALCARIEERLP